MGINTMFNVTTNLEFKMTEVFKSALVASIIILLITALSTLSPFVTFLGESTPYFDFAFVFVMLFAAVHVIRVIR